MYSGGVAVREVPVELSYMLCCWMLLDAARCRSLDEWRNCTPSNLILIPSLLDLTRLTLARHTGSLTLY